VDLTSGWTFGAMALEGDPVDLAGVSPWSADWVPVAVGNVTVSHPSYPRQRHELSVYKLASPAPTAFFAAGEFSNGVWAFYLPSDPMREYLTRHHL
jgi:hypothetical protein